MREIKFRTWNDAKNRMEYDVYKEYKNLMQYTGLKDINSKEIYEGDIVECCGGDYEVVYDCYRFKLKGFWCSCFDIADDAFSEGIQYMTVIGNIYENPYLLK